MFLYIIINKTFSTAFFSPSLSRARSLTAFVARPARNYYSNSINTPLPHSPFDVPHHPTTPVETKIINSESNGLTPPDIALS